MALQKKLNKESFDKLPETLKTEYTVNPNNAEEYTLSVEGDEDVTGLKSALDKERKARADAEKAAKKFEGIDPEKYQSVMAREQELEQERLKQAGKFDELKTQMIDNHKKELAKKDEALVAKDKAVGKLLIENAAREALAAAKVKGTGKAVMPLIMSSTKVEYDAQAGEYKALVLDARGNPRISGSDGEPMTIAQFVAELKADPELGVNFEASGTTGGGSQQQGARTATPPGVIKIAKGDQAAMAANLENIASGKAVVVDA